MSASTENIDAFLKTHLNVLDVQSEYKARQRVPPTEPGKKPKYRSDSGELLLNPNPLLFQQELQRRKEVFENLKVTYLEQETKEKFLRSLLTDPPQLVEQQDLEDIRAENRQKKSVLKAEKIKVAELENSLTDGSREVIMEYEDVKGKALDAQRMAREMQEMQREIDEIQALREKLEIPKHDDPDLNLPADQMRKLAQEYSAQKIELDQALADLQTQTPKVEQEKAQLSGEISRLTNEKITIEKKANKLLNRQKNVTQQQNEATGKWYRAMISLMENVHDIRDVSIRDGAATFTSAGQQYTIQLDEHGAAIPSTRLAI